MATDNSLIRIPTENPYYERERYDFSVCDLEYRMEQAAVHANALEERAHVAYGEGDIDAAERFLNESDAEWRKYRELRAELDDYEGGFSL